MVRENVKELVDFVKTESPYRSANKGWLTDYIYLNLGNSSNKKQKKLNQVAGLSLFWEPINKLISIVFVVFLVTIVFVFCSISFSKGNLKFSSFKGNDFFPNEKIISQVNTTLDESSEIQNDKEIEEIQQKENELDSDIVDQNLGEQLNNFKEPENAKTKSLTNKTKSNLF